MRLETILDCKKTLRPFSDDKVFDLLTKNADLPTKK